MYRLKDNIDFERTYYFAKTGPMDSLDFSIQFDSSLLDKAKIEFIAIREFSLQPGQYGSPLQSILLNLRQANGLADRSGKETETVDVIPLTSWFGQQNQMGIYFKRNIILPSLKFPMFSNLQFSLFDPTGLLNPNIFDYFVFVVTVHYSYK